MKIFLSLAAIASVVSAQSLDRYEVNVACSGLDVDNISPKALAYSAKAIEDSFNALDVDGVTLGKVAASGPLLPLDNKLRRGASCRFCANDDEVFSDVISFSAINLGRGASCRFCANDDELYATQLLGDTTLKAWEKNFAQLMTESTLSALKGVKSCKIQFAPRNGEEDKLKEVETPVGIHVDCNNVDFADISVRDLSFTAKALAESFNAANKPLGGSTLGHVALSGPRLQVVGRGASCRFCANDDEIYMNKLKRGASCRFCANDDEIVTNALNQALFFSAIELQRGASCRFCANDDMLKRGASCRFCANDDEILNDEAAAGLKAWEDLFVAHLLKDPTGAFKHVNSCSITMAGKKETSIA